MVLAWTSCRAQASFHAPSVAMESAATSSSATASSSGLKRLTKDPDYRCTPYQGTAGTLDGRPQKEVQVSHVKTAWKKFKELQPVLSSRHLSFKTCGHVYSSCVRSSMLHANETWPLTKPNCQNRQRNDRAMVR